MTRHATWVVVLTAATSLASGCGDAPAPPPPPAASTSAQVDQLEEGELAEGPSSAFGLPFPAALRVESRGRDRVAASGPVRFERVTNYVRDRIDAAQTSTGPGRTVFDRVTIRSPRPRRDQEKPRAREGQEEETLRVDVAKTHRGTQIVVSRQVRPRPPEGLTEDQRWERLGLTKDGRPADPSRFE